MPSIIVNKLHSIVYKLEIFNGPLIYRADRVADEQMAEKDGEDTYPHVVIVITLQIM